MIGCLYLWCLNKLYKLHTFFSFNSLDKAGVLHESKQIIPIGFHYLVLAVYNLGHGIYPQNRRRQHDIPMEGGR